MIDFGKYFQCHLVYSWHLPAQVAEQVQNIRLQLHFFAFPGSLFSPYSLWTAIGNNLLEQKNPNLKWPGLKTKGKAKSNIMQTTHSCTKDFRSWVYTIFKVYTSLSYQLRFVIRCLSHQKDKTLFLFQSFQKLVVITTRWSRNQSGLRWPSTTMTTAPLWRVPNCCEVN